MKTTKRPAATILGVIGVLLVGWLATQPPAKAANDKKPRHFYLTTSTHAGSQALAACAAGFHMASLWEIFDPSNAAYDTVLGVTTGDSGSGAPTAVRGWIRTGTAPSGFLPAVRANCHAWTSSDSADSGSLVQLSPAWSIDSLSASPWLASAELCSAAERVWCVSD